MKNKKFLFITSVILTIIAVGYIVINKKTESLLPPELSPSYKPVIVNKLQDTVLFENSDYSIMFFPTLSSYGITILNPAFETTRLKAEKTFLEVTKFSQDEACIHKVIINTIISVNPELAGKQFRLSFCARPSPTATPVSLPDVPINPALRGLSVVKTTPRSGKTAMAGTRGSIFIDFEEEVILNSTRITITPQTSYLLKTHPTNKKELIIIPDNNWQAGTYKIVLKAGLLSLSGKTQLKEDYDIKFEMIPVPPIPDYPEGGI